MKTPQFEPSVPRALRALRSNFGAVEGTGHFERERAQHWSFDPIQIIGPNCRFIPAKKKVKVLAKTKLAKKITKSRKASK